MTVRYVQCQFCGARFRYGMAGTYQRVSGWAKHRTAGGTNQVSRPERIDRHACGPCIDAMGHGRSPGQLSIYDALEADDG